MQGGGKLPILFNTFYALLYRYKYNTYFSDLKCMRNVSIKTKFDMKIFLVSFKV